ncbi:MAG TPA: acyl--CoA ligase [Caulobacteraceae bacterium]|jgi:acyl-CoA synthetase (AMP-forming)/AMP-acid ligase II|nr:acyl--CoA ligase [Caulobacteraceae bacterium]
MTSAVTIKELLAKGGDGDVAITAPAAVPLTFKGLREQVDETIAAMNRLGIGRGDRVAIVLPNGPEMAVAFLGIAAGAASAPLNPQYRADEFEFYLTDLNAKALVVEAGADTPATQVAARLGVPVISLKATPRKGAGRFVLDADIARPDAPAAPDPAVSSDVALVLHTSGTTSRPKIVPLTQANVCASARNVTRTLALTVSDRGLVIMPLFHIHGLIAGVLAPLSVGGSIYCAPGFNALKVFGWIEEARPTWYTAVPTMHQIILARAGHNAATIAANPLRFIRSSSASLPPQVLAELESTFGTRVIESYGMTEAAHQMTSNLLAPGARKPGAVGVAAGPEVAIMDEAGRLLAQGETGEIVIRGDNVTPGYENNPDANAQALSRGWFRTGDQGRMDEDGFLTITGRLKEIISRGGEKISPREVDEVLMDHPAVMQVVTFAIPHDKLGEEVAAAVVVREGSTVTERALRDFVAARLADFKTPRKIVFLNEIPKGATGKLQRIGLAQKLGL